MAFFEHDKISFHYRDEGQGLPFFFQHGLGADITQPFDLFHPPAGVRLIASLIREYGPVRGKELFLESAEYKEAIEQWPDVARSLAGQFDDPRVEETVAKFVRIIADKPCESLEQLRSIRVPTLVLANDV